MIDDWSSYTVADFIPFTAEVWFRLLARVGETWWPLHLLTVALGLFLLRQAWVGSSRPAGIVLAAVVAWVALVFVFGEYAELNWAGSWIGAAWLTGAALLALFSILPASHSLPHPHFLARWIGRALALFGLLGHPLIAPITGHGWIQAETFGLHADPTAVVWLGIALATLGGWRAWLGGIVPLLWCLLSALTLQALEVAWAGVLYALFGLGLFGLLAAANVTRAGSRKPDAATRRLSRLPERRSGSDAARTRMRHTVPGRRR